MIYHHYWMWRVGQLEGILHERESFWCCGFFKPYSNTLLIIQDIAVTNDFYFCPTLKFDNGERKDRSHWRLLFKCYLNMITIPIQTCQPASPKLREIYIFQSPKISKLVRKILRKVIFDGKRFQGGNHHTRAQRKLPYFHGRLQLHVRPPSVCSANYLKTYRATCCCCN